MGHIPHLLLPGPWPGPRLPLSEAHQHHLFKVLRVPEGGTISYTDGAGVIGQGELENGAMVRGREATLPRPTDLIVAVAPPSSRQRARFLVEKLAELGVAGIAWVVTRHGEGRPPPAAKSSAWVTAALEQSRGAWLTEVNEAEIADFDPGRLVVSHPQGAETVPAVVDPVLLIGPEGGLAEDEVPVGGQRLSLGPTVLRVETAAIVGTVLVSRLHPRGTHH